MVYGGETLYRQLLPEELEKIKAYVGEECFDQGKFSEATLLFDRLVKEKEFIEFLTLPAYEMI